MYSTEEKFYTAVDIIKNLPPSGPIQPSNELKLKFYSYYKQATEGPCEPPRPYIWDVISRAKWDAWNKLGNMSKEEAMKHYVDEFTEIIKEHRSDDLNMYGTIEDLEEVKKYANLMGPYIEYAPPEVREFYLQTTGKATLNNNDPRELSENYNSNDLAASTHNDARKLAVNGHNTNSNDSDSDEFSDTLDRVDESEVPAADGDSGVVSMRGGGDPRPGKSGSSPGTASGPRNRGLERPPRDLSLPTSLPRSSAPASSGGAGGSGRGGPPDVDEEDPPGLALAVVRLQHVLEHVVDRLDSLERLLSERRKPRPSFLSTPRVAMLLLLAWPLLLQWIVIVMRRRQRRL